MKTPLDYYNQYVMTVIHPELKTIVAPWLLGTQTYLTLMDYIATLAIPTTEIYGCDGRCRNVPPQIVMIEDIWTGREWYSVDSEPTEGIWE